MKKIILLACILISTLLFAQPGTIDLSFNSNDTGFGNGDGPRFNEGTTSVSVMRSVIQSDGKIIIVGGFTSYNGIGRNHITRINSDGSLDTTFNPGTGANNGISDTSIQSDGKIIIVGGFTSYNGIGRNHITRINSDGSLDTTFNPGTGANGIIRTISIQSDGKIILGGNFTSYNGVGRNRIARINSDGSLDTAFNPGSGANGFVWTTSIQSDGKIIVGGQFAIFNNIQRPSLVRLNTNGTLDTSFNNGLGLNGLVSCIRIQSDGGVIIGGTFTIINNLIKKGIARFQNNGSLDAFFGGNYIYGNVNDICLQPDGKIVVGSSILNFNNTTTNYLYRMSNGGAIENAFNPSFLAPTIASVSSITIQNDGKLIIGASGSNAYLKNKHLIRINSNGTLDTSFNVGSGANFPVCTTSIQNDGKILIGGDFLRVNGMDRFKIARLNTNGTLDITAANPITEKETGIRTSSIQSDGKILIGGGLIPLKRLNLDLSYDTEFPFSPTGINTLAIQEDGKIIMGGQFSSTTSFPINLLGRIYSNGSFDTSFNFNGFNNVSGYEVSSITTLTGDKKIISGSFAVIYGTTASRYITRLNSNNIIDNSFMVNICNNIVEYHKIQNDGKILIGGNFTLCHGISRNRIARLNSDGSNDTTFNPGTGANGIIRTISIQSDGKIILGGDFTTFNGIPLNYLARLNIDGSLDNTFNIGTGPNDIVRTTSIQSDGKIIIGGDFTSYNGVGRNRIARINSGAALSNPSFDINKIAIYPNPSNGYFNVKIDDSLTTKIIEVYSILGQKIYSKSIVENESTLDISNQPKGIYFYKISDNKNVIKSGKLILE